MKYVTCFGGLWKLTNRQYKTMLQSIAAGIETNLNDYGKNIGIIDLNVTDLTPDEAKDYL